MRRSKIYVGLEIGTSKVCLVVGEGRADGGIKILSMGQAVSRGVRKGEIIDPTAAQKSLNETLVSVEEDSGLQISEVFLAISGAHMASLNLEAELEIPDGPGEIVPDDLAELKEVAREAELPADHAFVHTLIREYGIDGRRVDGSPVGQFGTILSGSYHLIHGDRNRIHNTIRCVNEIPLGVQEIVFSPLAAAQVALTRAQREGGALMIDMGGGTTDYVAFTEGAISHSGSIAVGGDHVSNDIATVFEIPLQSAEYLKTREGSVYFDTKDVGAPVSIAGIPGLEGRQIDGNDLNQVIHLRLRETFELIRDELESMRLLDRLGSGIFLTGGASLLQGANDLAQALFQLPVNSASDHAENASRATLQHPQYATPIGLVRYAQLVDQQNGDKKGFGSLGQRIGGWLGVA